MGGGGSWRDEGGRLWELLLILGTEFTKCKTVKAFRDTIYCSLFSFFNSPFFRFFSEMLEFAFQRSSAEMDLVAGAGSVFSQLAVGLAGGALPEGAAGGGAGGPMANGLFKMGGRFAPKPTVDSLPDKVRSRGRSQGRPFPVSVSVVFVAGVVVAIIIAAVFCCCCCCCYCCCCCLLLLLLLLLLLKIAADAAIPVGGKALNVYQFFAFHSPSLIRSC